jgi:putative thioredoxin
MNDMIIGQNLATSANPADLIKDADARSFAADVIEASKKLPVIVDFWAPWCGPCKQLTPIIEKVVRQANGKVRLVKINVDENQQIAAQLRVQSIPAVFAFVNGQPIDGFMGALPESQVKQFIDKLSSKGSLAEEIAAALKMAEEAMARREFAEAHDILGQILGADPTHIGALAALVHCFIGLGDFESASAALASVPQDKVNTPAVISATAALDIALHPVDTSVVDQLLKDVIASPNDFQKRLDLAIALNGAGQRSEATDHLLHVFKKDRNWNEDAARKQLVQFFEAWGPKDEFTLSGRRKLSSLMFS